MEKMNEIFEMMEQFKADATAFKEKGNKSAGARARKVSLEIRQALKTFRAECVEEANAMPKREKKA